MASPNSSLEGGENEIEGIPIEKMDKDDLVDWLLEKNIPIDYCKVFEGKLYS